MIRVAIVDDHPLVLDALTALVDAQADMCVVGAYADGQAVIDAGALACDVLVLDLSLPGQAGFTVMEALRARQPDVRVVVYSMYAETLMGPGARAAGAAMYLRKSRPPVEVLRAIRDVARGEERAVVADAAPHHELTARQRELFLLVCEGASPGDLVRRLDLSPSTVSSHLAAIRAKLGAETNGEILLYAARTGLLEP